VILAPVQTTGAFFAFLPRLKNCTFLVFENRSSNPIFELYGGFNCLLLLTTDLRGLVWKLI
jgi:hypothetical protein